MIRYEEPLVSFLILDFLKEGETRLCLESIRRHAKFPHKVIYLHNGPAEYPITFLREGLIDVFVQTGKNHGLGVGTRDLFALCFSPLAILLQNDQYLHFDVDETMLMGIAAQLGTKGPGGRTIASISLAGPVGGQGIYSERCHLITSTFYRQMETQRVLGTHGAGPYHDGPWREAQIQRFYHDQNLTHYSPPIEPWVVDNGRRAVRENPDGSLWEHKPDTKELRLLRGPIKEKHVYPRFSQAEWEFVLANQTWPENQIPEEERAHSFKAW